MMRLYPTTRHPLAKHALIKHVFIKHSRLKHSRIKHSRIKQGGASLLVALVILIALTLIGVSSMNSTVTALKMANNSKLQSSSFNHSDELLTLAEKEVSDLVAAVKNGTSTANPFLASTTDGFYKESEAINVNTLNWQALGKNPVNVNNISGNYIIEFLGKRVKHGESADETAPTIGDQFYAYRISARSESRQVVRMMQSIYVTNAQPY